MLLFRASDSDLFLYILITRIQVAAVQTIPAKINTIFKYAMIHLCYIAIKISFLAGYTFSHIIPHDPPFNTLLPFSLSLW